MKDNNGGMNRVKGAGLNSFDLKGISIVYEDEEILVCEKPAGVPVQSADLRTKDMESILKNYLYEKARGEGGEAYIGVVHRLDQPVQGVMVFAKTKLAVTSLNAQMNKGQFKKFYQAAVCGKLSQDKGTLVDYLYKDGKTNTSKIVKKDAKDAKKAELNYRILKKTEQYSLLEIELLTGRHHQIRVQLAAAGVPIYGDKKYNLEFMKNTQPMQLGLCASRLEFMQPKTRKKLSFTCNPMGEAFMLL